MQKLKEKLNKVDFFFSFFDAQLGIFINISVWTEQPLEKPAPSTHTSNCTGPS